VQFAEEFKGRKEGKERSGGESSDTEEGTDQGAGDVGLGTERGTVLQAGEFERTGGEGRGVFQEVLEGKGRGGGSRGKGSGQGDRGGGVVDDGFEEGDGARGSLFEGKGRGIEGKEFLEGLVDTLRRCVICG
jgi:hypothetical protein